MGVSAAYAAALSARGEMRGPQRLSSFSYAKALPDKDADAK